MITTRELRERTSYHWLLNADDWVTVTDRGGTPLWQFRRGSQVVFDNAGLPRCGWTEFQRMRVADKLALLAKHSVVVLVARGSDAFLVRLPQ